jgi:hypothetical protein
VPTVNRQLREWERIYSTVGAAGGKEDVADPVVTGLLKTGQLATAARDEHKRGLANRRAFEHCPVPICQQARAWYAARPESGVE